MVACCAFSILSHADIVKPWLGRSRRDALAGTAMVSLPENLAPPPISEAGVKPALDADGLFL
jgi:hypothetical protein